MTQPIEPDPAEQGPKEGAEVSGALEDALPVLAGPPRIVEGRRSAEALPGRRAGAMRPAVQAAAVAAGGFVAGAAVAGLVHRRQQRSPLLRAAQRGGRALSGGGAGAGAAELLQIVSSRSMLVDVHLLSDD